MADWFSPSPDRLPTSRVQLDFGLRSADRFFQERTVPGIGGVRFVRQLSWAVAAIALQGALPGPRRPTPTEVAHALEAVACKLEWLSDPENTSRINGTRAFARSPELLSADALSQRRHYVQVTFRQGTLRALVGGDALGLATGGRFNSLRLTPVGAQLAKDFLYQGVGRGSGFLRSYLLVWLQGQDLERFPSMRPALSPRTPSAEEVTRVHARLFERQDAASLRRQRLREQLQGAELPHLDTTLPELLEAAGHSVQAAELRVARAFCALFDRSRDLADALTTPLVAAGGKETHRALALVPEVAARAAHLRTAAAWYRKQVKEGGLSEASSVAWAGEVVASPSDAALIGSLVKRPNSLLATDGTRIHRDASFQERTPTDLGEAANPLASGRMLRVDALYSLIGDGRSS